MAQQWNFLKTPGDYENAMRRLEAIIDSAKDSPDHNEALLLSLLLSKYQEEYLLPSVDPIRMIKSRMRDFHYTANDLVKAYGDEGTVNKVLNYQEPLSLTMIRKFSKLLRIPADLLVSEYQTAH
jgi:HTH-type transcriptional regulator / antitoxin HigA